MPGFYRRAACVLQSPARCVRSLRGKITRMSSVSPTLIAIEENTKLIGTVVFCNTPVSCGPNEYNCYYARYFAAAKAIRGSGIIPRMAVKSMQVLSEQEREKTIYFACVEKSNTTSYKTVQFAGYSDIGTIKTMGFSRFFPRRQPIESIDNPEKRREMLNLLKAGYQAHALVQFNSLFMQNAYYVIRENGRIVAGCQYHRVHWVVRSMDGWSGKLIVNFAPRVPLLRRFFNPGKFEFLAFEGIYVLPGYEKHLSRLFDGLLAKEKLYSALYWMAENCPLRQRIATTLHHGLLHSFVKNADSNIMASFHQLSPDEISDIKARPLYASAFDYI